MKLKLFCLITWAVATTAAHLPAQSFMTLYNFTGGGDGETPNAGLVLSGNILYGTTRNGASPQWGTVFAVNTDGSGFTTLYSFTDVSDGARPTAGLVLSGNTLYGTAVLGGSGNYGTVFAVNTDGTDFTTLYSFAATNDNGIITNSDGAEPYCELVLSGNTLYGTTAVGASGLHGAVFAVNTDGTGFTNLHIFTATAGTAGLSGAGTNGDGAVPRAGLILAGNTLYGTAAGGGSSGNGTVFAVNTDGSGFRTLYSFTTITGTSGVAGIGANGDGASPVARLILSGDTLYGTTFLGGSSGDGTVFAVKTNGTGFTTLYSFSAATAPDPGAYSFSGPNSDGAEPVASLILSGNTLYGTATAGGSSGDGTVFALNTDGTGFTNLYSFTSRTGPPVANSDGAAPRAELVLADNTLYGTASTGGSSDAGTVFSLSLPPVTPPQLTITPSGANVILTWPATATGFTLQSTTNLGSSAIWTTNSPAPVVLNGQNVVTNPIAGAQQFFRLSR